MAEAEEVSNDAELSLIRELLSMLLVEAVEKDQGELTFGARAVLFVSLESVCHLKHGDKRWHLVSSFQL